MGHTQEELAHIINNGIRTLNITKNIPAELYQPIEYTLSMGGKRLRPTMALMACEMFGENITNYIHPAIAIEIFHNYTLIHDDIMDGAVKRRNKDCVHTKWDTNTAILSGDAMHILAYKTMQTLPGKKLAQSMSLFLETALGVHEGQQYDMNFETRETVSEKEYLNMIRLKTAVLIAGSLKLGAIWGNATEKDADLIYDFGINTGLAFQLRDDFLDVYGNSEIFGKKTGGDIINNKKTLLLIKALEKASIEDYEKLSYWINKKDFREEEKIDAVTNIFNKLNISKYCLDLIDTLINKSLDALDKISIDKKSKINLYSLSEKLTKRIK